MLLLSLSGSLVLALQSALIIATESRRDRLWMLLWSVGTATFSLARLAQWQQDVPADARGFALLALASALASVFAMSQHFAATAGHASPRRVSIAAGTIVLMLATLGTELVLRRTMIVRVEMGAGAFYAGTPGPLLPLFGLAVLGHFMGGVRSVLRSETLTRRERWMLVGAQVTCAMAVATDVVTLRLRLRAPILSESLPLLLCVAVSALDASRAQRSQRDLEREVNARTEALRRATAVAAEAERLSALGLLASSVGHEVNNPAMALLSALEQLAARPDASRDVILAEATDAALRIRDIAGDLRAFGPPGDAKAPTDLEPAVAAAVRLTRLRLRGVAELQTRLEARWVEGDERRLVQVLVNLIVNAAQAMDPATASENLIEVRSEAVGARVVIRVIDNGPGFAPEVLTRAFEPFVTTRGAAGSGLGLALCRRFVHELGGEIALRNQTPRGAEVEFTLRSADAPRAQPSTAPAPRRRVLVVDDDAAVLVALGRMLRAHDVTAVASVEAARAVLATGARFDLALCDVMMPEEPGTVLWEVLRDRWPDAVARFAFISGGVFEPEVRAAIARSGAPLLAKPLRAGDLASLLR
ncbi:MAG: ATP-binding protein [Polyangiales bacterium]